MNAEVGFSDCIVRVPVEFKRNRDWEQWFLLTSDRHFDNPASDQALQLRHLDQAKERNAKVIDIGDFFCAMQGKYDPRGTKSDVRPEHNRDDYLDALVESALAMFLPYSSLFLLIGKGNHELALLKRLETDLTKRLVSGLNATGANIELGGYRGWIRLLFRCGTFVQTINIYYTHGANSNAPVTKGILQTGRRSVFLPDADIILSGHIHESWCFPLYRARLSQKDREYMDKQLHIQLPTYKDEFFGKQSNFHHINSRPPKPIGGWWLKFYFDNLTNRIKFTAVETD